MLIFWFLTAYDSGIVKPNDNNNNNNSNNNNNNDKIKLIDVSVPSDRNTSTKVIVKLSKYKDLEIKTNENMGKEDRDCVGYCWCAGTY